MSRRVSMGRRGAAPVAAATVAAALSILMPGGVQAQYDGARAGHDPRFIGRPAKSGTKPSDAILNYDGVGSKVNRNDRDWPLTIIWKKEASRAKIREALGFNVTPPGRDGPRGGLKIREPYKELSWDAKRRTSESKGGKSECPATEPKDVHVRFYGSAKRASTRFYDPTSGGWGFFVASSTHYDFAEETGSDQKFLNDQRPNPCFGTQSAKWGGLSERAARTIEDEYVEPKNNIPSDPFGVISRDQYETKNWEGQTPRPNPPAPAEPPYRIDMTPGNNDANHRWQNDALATLIVVK
jgi:hypothetical protein